MVLFVLSDRVVTCASRLYLFVGCNRCSDAFRKFVTIVTFLYLFIAFSGFPCPSPAGTMFPERSRIHVFSVLQIIQMCGGLLLNPEQNPHNGFKLSIWIQEPCKVLCFLWPKSDIASDFILRTVLRRQSHDGRSSRSSAQQGAAGFGSSDLPQGPQAPQGP